MLIFGPILLAVVLALVQWLIYRGLQAVGAIDEVPFFFAFIFRSILIVLALAVIAAIVLHYSGGGSGLEEMARDL